MELEHSVHTFTIDETLQAKVDALVKEGWQLPPGTPPVAIYHLVRVKPEAAPQPGLNAIGTLLIDDSKIMVIPAGQKTQ